MKSGDVPITTLVTCRPFAEIAAIWIVVQKEFQADPVKRRPPETTGLGLSGVPPSKVQAMESLPSSPRPPGFTARRGPRMPVVA